MRGDDAARDPHRARISQYELFERSLVLDFDKQSPVELDCLNSSRSSLCSCLDWTNKFPVEQFKVKGYAFDKDKRVLEYGVRAPVFY